MLTKNRGNIVSLQRIRIAISNHHGVLYWFFVPSAAEESGQHDNKLFKTARLQSHEYFRGTYPFCKRMSVRLLQKYLLYHPHPRLTRPTRRVVFRSRIPCIIVFPWLKTMYLCPRSTFLRSHRYDLRRMTNTCGINNRRTSCVSLVVEIMSTGRPVSMVRLAFSFAKIVGLITHIIL